MKEKIKLFRDLVLIRHVEPPEKTKGGIVLPKVLGENDEPVFFDVVAVGKKVSDLKKGDRIVTWKHTGGQDFRFNGENLLIMRERNIFGVLNK